MPIDFAKGQAVSIASSKLQKVAGNLPGLLGLNKGKVKRDSSDTSPLNQKGKSNPNLFQFPLDVAGDPGIGNHGHYIIFFINEQKGSTLRFADHLKSGNETIKKEKNDREIPDFVRKNFGAGASAREQASANTYQNATNTDDYITDFGGPLPDKYVGGGNYTEYAKEQAEKKPLMIGGMNVQIKRPPTKRLDTAIAMYMPQQLQTQYAANYTDPEISGIATAVGSIAERLTNGGKITLEGIAKTIQSDVVSDVEKRILLKTLGGLDALGVTGAREAVEISTGEIIADRMELSFKGVARRPFQYTFKMIPRNSREAEEIRKIIFAFKSNMLPEMIKGMDRDTMNIPNTFNIQYMYKGKENDYVHRVSECFLDNMQVSYGGDRYKTFEPHADDGAPPVETTIILSFKEIEIITREKIFEGF